MKKITKFIVLTIILVALLLILGGLLLWYTKTINNQGSDTESTITDTNTSISNTAVAEIAEVPNISVTNTTVQTDQQSINRGLDERNIDDSDSIGTGTKLVFIDATTGERIRNEKVTLDSDNGIRCFNIGCDSFDTIFETQTDHNGVAFIDFSQWPKFSFGHILLDNWGCNGSISRASSDNYLYLTDGTEQLLLECVSETVSSQESQKKYFKLLEVGTDKELKNVTVTIDIENCGGDNCSDLRDATLTSNQLGNLFFDGDYLRADTYFIIDGYKPLSVTHNYEDHDISFIKIVDDAETSIAIEDQIKAMRYLQNAVELYYSENAVYPHPQTWDELVEALQVYVEPFPVSIDSAITYTYGYSTEEELYCFITTLAGYDQVLSRDEDRDRCTIRPGVWQPVSNHTPESDCDDDELLFCLGT